MTTAAVAKNRHFLAISELTRADVLDLLAMSARLKAEWYASRSAGLVPPAHLAGSSLASIFEKPSLRTRCSFEVGMYQLGGHAVNLQAHEVGKLGERESISDTARCLSRWTQIIQARVFYHGSLEELAKWSSVPIINGLSDFEHPTQVIADYLTIHEERGSLDNFTLGWIGDGYNVCNSLMFMAALLGHEMVMAIPHNYEPRDSVWEKLDHIDPTARQRIRIVREPAEVAKLADVLYTDIWTSMGYEAEAKIREKAFSRYKIDAELMKHARPHAFVLHDLPAKRGLEISDEVLDGPRCRAWDQAENRLHAIKAILCWCLGVAV